LLKTVGVLDSGVSQSTCSWATAIAHLLPQGARSNFKPNQRDPREEAPHEENDTYAVKTQSSPHELVRRKTKPTSPCAPPTLWRRIRQEKKQTWRQADHVTHTASTGRRQHLTHLHKAVRRLLLSRKAQRGWCSAPGKDLALPQPLPWIRTSLHRGQRPPMEVTG
jgi:hypothetical protein